MQLRFLDLRGVPVAEMGQFLPRPDSRIVFPTEEVRSILDAVRQGGDDALRELTMRFDRVDVKSLRVLPDDIEAAMGVVDPSMLRALRSAHERITAYHSHQDAAPRAVDARFELEGVVVRDLLRPVGRAGMYAPGGRARYPSTVLMCAVPAEIAGVQDLALCVPPGPDGEIAVETLAAAGVAGVDEVYRVGGAQAVAAMAFGTETIRPTDVIVGPGNRYVAEAKRQVSGIVGVPSAFTGPSEVVVVAGPETPVQWAAIDVLVQAEHGPDGVAWFVTWSEPVCKQVVAEIERLVAASPRRADLEATLSSGGYAALVDGPDEAVALANEVAPEHLELLMDGAEGLLDKVQRAGAVFLGPWSPASAGDYAAGPNHVLPTARTARFASALGVDDFRTKIHAVSLDQVGLRGIADTITTLADAEGLPAHSQSVRVRLSDAP